MAEASTLSGLSSRSSSGRGPNSERARRWPKPQAVRSEDRFFPVSGEELQTLRSAGLKSLDDPEGSPSGWWPIPVASGFPLTSGVDLPYGFPSFRSDRSRQFPTVRVPPSGFPSDVAGKVDHPHDLHKPRT